MHNAVDKFFNRLFGNKAVVDALDKAGFDAWYWAGMVEYLAHRVVNLFEKDERWS